jgi:hypothetical protein
MVGGIALIIRRTANVYVQLRDCIKKKRKRKRNCPYTRRKWQFHYFYLFFFLSFFFFDKVKVVKVSMKIAISISNHVLMISAELDARLIFIADRIRIWFEQSNSNVRNSMAR